MFAPEAFHQCRILVVDDEPLNTALLEKLLKQSGYRFIQSTTDPTRVEKLYREFKPDLVLLDLVMPVMDGFQVMEKLQAIEKDSYIPVLVLTASSASETRLQALRAGARDYINKPLDFNEVHQRIRNLLEVRMLYNEVRQQNSLLESAVRERTRELRESLSQLMHAEKLSAVGKLAASICHEFNNPILGIRNILEQVREQIPATDKLHSLADLAANECSRVMSLAVKLKQFYRPSLGVPSPLNLHALIDDMIDLCGKALREKNIELVRDYQSDLPPLRAVEDQIKQVILNLLHNAEEAIANGKGKISISTRGQGDQVRIRIEDNGCGIASEHMDKIFEPFFTTKSAVKGTGLGLSVSYGIVRRHGGNIECRSEAGRGSAFTLTLPLEAPDGMEVLGE